MAGYKIKVNLVYSGGRSAAIEVEAGDMQAATEKLDEARKQVDALMRRDEVSCNVSARENKRAEFIDATARLVLYDETYQAEEGCETANALILQARKLIKGNKP